MAKLADCTSLIQLAATLNLAAPAIQAALGGLQAGIVEQYRVEYGRMRPEKKLDEFAEAIFSEFVTDSHKNIVRLVSVLSWLPVLSIAAVAISVYGLTLAGIRPETPVPDELVWVFGWVVVVGLPLSYLAVQNFVRFLDREIAVHIVQDKPKVDLLFDCFEIMVTSKRNFSDIEASLGGRSIAELLLEARRLGREARRSILQARVSALLDKLRRGFWKRD